MRNLPKFHLLLVAAFVLSLQSIFAKPHEIDLSPHANDDIHAQLTKEFPIGVVVPPNNQFGVPFKIPADAPNFITLDKTRNTNPLILNIGVDGARRVYTLIQSYAAYQGRTSCQLIFNGKNGAHQTVDLLIGEDVRDFFEGGFCNVINNTSTRNAFEFIGKGGAFTSNTDTGPRGFYHFDEQEIVLDPAFAKDTLDTITIVAPEYYSCRPILLGLTVEDADTNAPIPVAPVTIPASLPATTISPVTPTSPPTSPPTTTLPDKYTVDFHFSILNWLIVGGVVFVLLVVAVVAAIRRWLNAP